MRVFFSLFCLMAFADTTRGADLYVPDSYSSIMDAVFSAADGDRIIVRPGTYMEMIGFIGKKITILGESGPTKTTIDGLGIGTVVSFVFGEGQDSVLEGFTITNGLAYWGGGIYSLDSSPTIRKVVITDNVGIHGGGICFYGASNPIVTECTITKNYAIYAGGGISCMNSRPLISNNYITKNRVLAKLGAESGKGGRAAKKEYGGGIYCHGSSATIINNRINENIAGGAAERIGYGGGICCVKGSTPTIANNIFFDNKATCGGALSCSASDAWMAANTLVSNAAVSGGLGGGIFCSNGAYVSVSSSILWNNTAPSGGEEISLINGGAPSSLAIAYSDVKGGETGAIVESGCSLIWEKGMIDASPIFVEPANGDLHLCFDSPCRDTGTGGANPTPLLYDFEGDPRTTGDLTDMGADEFWPHLYCIGEALPGASINVRVIGTPGTGPVLLATTLEVQDPPAPTVWGDLYLQPPLIWQKTLGNIPATGFLDTPMTLPGSFDPVKDHPFQALIGPMANQNSELTNLFML
jgi:hypothetical protein